VNSQTNLRQQELQLKNLLSRTALRTRCSLPSKLFRSTGLRCRRPTRLPPLKDLLQTALANRSDLAAERLGITSSEISALGTRNGILPLLVGIATKAPPAWRVSRKPRSAASASKPPTLTSTAESAPRSARCCGVTSQPIRVAGVFQTPLRNDQAQADYAIDQLQLRQSQIQLSKDLNQVAVDVSNYLVAMRQARGRYRAAVQTRILQQQLLDAEQKKLAGGASTPFNVVQQQRDLVPRSRPRLPRWSISAMRAWRWTRRSAPRSK
jgi:outer membrane protein